MSLSSSTNSNMESTLSANASHAATGSLPKEEPTRVTHRDPVAPDFLTNVLTDHGGDTSPKLVEGHLAAEERGNESKREAMTRQKLIHGTSEFDLDHSTPLPTAVSVMAVPLNLEKENQNIKTIRTPSPHSVDEYHTASAEHTTRKTDSTPHNAALEEKEDDGEDEDGGLLPPPPPQENSLATLLHQRPKLDAPLMPAPGKRASSPDGTPSAESMPPHLSDPVSVLATDKEGNKYDGSPRLSIPDGNNVTQPHIASHPLSQVSSLSPPSSRRRERIAADDLSWEGSDEQRKKTNHKTIDVITRNETDKPEPIDMVEEDVDDANSLHSHLEEADSTPNPHSASHQLDASPLGPNALPYSTALGGEDGGGSSSRFLPNVRHHSGFVNAATRSSSGEEELTVAPLPKSPMPEPESLSCGNDPRLVSKRMGIPRNQSAFSNGVHSSSVFEQGFSGEYGSSNAIKGLPFDPSMTFVHLDPLKTDEDDPLYDQSIGDGGFSHLMDMVNHPMPVRRTTVPKPQKKDNTPHFIRQIRGSIHRVRRNVKDWSWHQIIWITLLLALVTVGNFLQIIMLNFWLVSFPDEVAASNYTVFALPGVLFFIFFAVTQIVYLIVARPNMSFAKSWTGQWLLFLIGFMDAINSWMAAYAASFTSEVLQALFMNLSPIYAVFMSKWILRDDRRYMNKWMIAVFVLTIVGVFVVTIYTFVKSPTFGNIAWIAIFFLSIPLRVLMNVWQSLYMIVYTYDSTFNEWLERRYIEEEVENAIRQQQGDLLLSQKIMRKRRKRMKINSKQNSKVGKREGFKKDARKEYNSGVKNRPSGSLLGTGPSGVQVPPESSHPFTHSSTHETGSGGGAVVPNASSINVSQTNPAPSGDFVMSALHRPTGNGFSGTFSAEHPLPQISSPLGVEENHSALFNSGVERDLQVQTNFATGSGSFVRQTMVSGSLFNANPSIGAAQRSMKRIKRKKGETGELHVPTSPPIANLRDSSVFKSRSSWTGRAGTTPAEGKRSSSVVSGSLFPGSPLGKEGEANRETTQRKDKGGAEEEQGGQSASDAMAARVSAPAELTTNQELLSPLTAAPGIHLHEAAPRSPTMPSGTSGTTWARPAALSEDEREVSKTHMFSAHLDGGKEGEHMNQASSRRASAQTEEAVFRPPASLQRIQRQSIVAQERERAHASGAGDPDEDEYEYVEEDEEESDEDEYVGRVPSIMVSREGRMVPGGMLYYRELEPDGVLNVLRSGTGEVVFRGEEREGLAAVQSVGQNKTANLFYGDDEDLDDGDDFDRVVRPNQPLGIPLRQQSRVIGIGTGIKLGGFRRTKRLYTPSAQISPYQKHYRELQDREGEDTSVKVFMLSSDTFWQLLISLALLPADALPWFGNSHSVNDTWHNFMEGIETVFTVKENTLYGFLYTMGFVFNYLGAAYLNHYSVALCSIVTQLSSPITALVLVIIPSWNKNNDGTPPWYLSLISIFMLSVAALIYVLWEEKTDDEKKEGEMQLKRYKLKL